MHRKVKGLLSMLLVCVMVSATVSPVSADELQPQPETPSQEQSVIEQESSQEQSAAPDADLQEVQTPSVGVTEEAAEEAETQGQSQIMEPLPAVEPVTQIATETEPEMAEELPELQPQTQDMQEKAEEEAAQVKATGAPTNEDLYNALTQDQIKFDVYKGSQPIQQILSEQDILSKLQFTEDAIVPDSANISSQIMTIRGKILDSREGDERFYSFAGLNLWSVDSDGKPINIVGTKSIIAVNQLATKQNFIDAAYMEKNESGAQPAVICKRPILEPIWTCINYIIPVYDQNGMDTGLTVTVTAENYNDTAQVAFPAGVEAGSWKLLYDGSEYTLGSASEIWTNLTNGIATIGWEFDVAKAKLQACPAALMEGTAEFIQPDWYVGQQPAAPQVSSETNGTDHVTYYYKVNGADDSTYTTQIPSTAGRYTAKAVFAQTAAYKEVVKTADFSILSAEPEVKYEISGPQGTEGWYQGAVTISAKAGYQVRLSEADAWVEAVTVAQSGNVTLYVKAADGMEYPAEQLQFLIDGTAPVVIGLVNGMTYYGDTPAAVTDDFLLKVTVNGVEQPIVGNRADFVLTPSDDAYIIKADDMAGNWFEGIVFVKEAPVTEPSVPEEPTGPPTEEPSVPPTETPDKTAPVISGIENKKTYYGTQKVTVTDENLQSVTVNGKTVTVADNRAELTITPSDDEYQFVIVAEDAAGNRTEYTVEVWEMWVQDGIMENGKKKLRRERSYKLGNGKWTITGDSTIYQGGRTFYVTDSGTYDFKKK